MLDHKVPVDQPMHPLGYTAVYVAAQNNHGDTLELLLKAGGDAKKIMDEWSPLHIAARHNSIDAVRVLLRPEFKSKVDVDFPAPLNGGGTTAAFVAVGKNHSEILELLAQAGANLNLRRNNGISCIHLAAKKGTEKEMRVLTNPEYKVDLNQKSSSGSTAVRIAVFHKNIPALTALAKAGADLTIPDVNGKSPMHLAVHRNEIDSVRVLLKYGNIDIKDKSGFTPLHYALTESHFEIAVLLLMKVDVNKRVTEQIENNITKKPRLTLFNMPNEEKKKTTDELAKKFDYWMKHYDHPRRTDNENLLSWIYADRGGRHVNDYKDFCDIARSLSGPEYKYSTQPPPTQAAYMQAMQEYFVQKQYFSKHR